MAVQLDLMHACRWTSELESESGSFGEACSVSERSHGRGTRQMRRPGRCPWLCCSKASRESHRSERLAQRSFSQNSPFGDRAAETRNVSRVQPGSHARVLRTTFLDSFHPSAMNSIKQLSHARRNSEAMNPLDSHSLLTLYYYCCCF